MRHLIKVSGLLFIVSTVLMAGCAAEQPGSQAKSSVEPLDARAIQMSAVPRRDVHREGTLAMRTKDPEKTEGEVQSLLDKVGGFFLESNLTKQEGRATLSATLKVPTERFAETIRQVSALGYVTSKTLRANDITSEIDQLRSRQATQEASRAKPQDPTALVEAQNQTAQKVAEASFSTLTLSVQQQMEGVGANDPAWFQNEAGNALASLGGAGRIAATGLIWLVVLSPVWGSMVAALVWLDRWLKRRPRPSVPPVI